MTKVRELTLREKALLAHIEAKAEAECSHSFDITHLERVDAGYSWYFARTKSMPFNVFLQFHFEFNVENAHNNADKIRAVSHHVLSYLHRNGRIPSNVIWTRTCPVESPGIEVCQLICHIPDNLYDDFAKYACKWEGLSIIVSKCSYAKEWEVHDGRTVSVFELMFSATSAKTRNKIADVYTTSSSIVYRPRVFTSQKLSRKEIEKEMKTMMALKQVEALQARLDADKEIV